MMLARRSPMKRTAFRRRRPAEGPNIERGERPLAKLAPATRRGVIAPIAAAVVSVPKRPRERRQHLLDMAQGKPCLFWFVPGCRGSDGSTTVQAHDNRLSANKGKGYKAHDWRSVSCCMPCHVAYDQGREHTREERDAAFDAAFARQLDAWRALAANPLARARDREAARWAVSRFEYHQLQGDVQ